MRLLGPKACLGFLEGGTGACILLCDAEYFPLIGRARSGGVFCFCEPNMTLGSMSANGWGCISMFLVVLF